MLSSGVVYVAYGPGAVKAARSSVASLKKFNNLSVVVIGEQVIEGARLIKFDDPGPGARWAKLNINLLVDWDYIIYLDADTEVQGDLSGPIKMLEAYDLIIAPSVNQNDKLLAHVSPAEREQTIKEIGNPFPLQLQAGVMFINRPYCAALFEEWRRQWRRWKDQDQAALLRALHITPVKIGLLGRDFNGGSVVAHHFGRAK